MWYTGTATVTTGSVEVIGDANVDFVSNVFPGDAFISAGNGLSIEILRADSRGKLILARPYSGPSGGFAFSVQPTQDYMRTLALGITDLKNAYGGYRDTILQGAFPDGSLAAPGMRFTADQDTGVARLGDNILALVAGGVARLTADLNGATIRGAYCNMTDAEFPQYIVSRAGVGSWRMGGLQAGSNSWALQLNAAPFLTVDTAGNLLVGIASAPEHTITKGAGQGSAVLRVRSNAAGALDSFVVASVSAYTPNGAGAAVYLGHSTATNRSLNTSGTINASGADYAEYMLKAAGCGVIAKGDVCGVDRDGKLTRAWADAVSFVVKSTDPSYVGGDTWAAHLPPRPDAPGAEPLPPALPVVPAEGADDAEVAAYQDGLAAYPVHVAQYRIDHDAWAAATAAYARDLSTWEAQLEAARVCVDRIAFCGQVPCNVSGHFEVGDYIVAAQDGDGIAAVAVKADAITLPQYMARIGKVWAIRDGRAWIDVQHG
ncbi:hypothetical protein [Sphingomonas yabuuchiae]|uniref:hypothetical protein n=1 Tax=Sphingomonas yabuuchiae TaxID=172044 RepID=UPI003D98A4A2